MNNSIQTNNEQTALIELNDQELAEVNGAFGHWGECCGLVDLDDCCYGGFHRHFHFHHRHHHVWWETDGCGIC
ncbi:hypothetical protein [Dictyobacter formicarum]|uniref:hypothetical protein n=1 Tax=Dictyobacter formicarum TaxID=2778368 RepID=UPI0019163609|nr:hypothetical protein [Dictyobacter formicarum]